MESEAVAVKEAQERVLKVRGWAGGECCKQRSARGARPLCHLQRADSHENRGTQL